MSFTPYKLDVFMLKQVIDDYIAHNNSLSDFINKSDNLYQEGSDVISSFVEKLKETRFSSDLGNGFSKVLQLSNDPRRFKSFELSDISRLYDSLCKLQESNIETYVNAAYFEFSVMDNPSKAKEIADAGLRIAKKGIEQLGTLLEEIRKESTSGI